jgi:hypothetical protein
METNLSKKIQIKITDSSLNQSSLNQSSFNQSSFNQSSLNQSSFMQSYSYNKSTDKLEEFKRKLRTKNYFEEDNDNNVIYPSTK